MKPRVYWTPEEEEILKANYVKMGKDVVTLLPRHTYQQCKYKAQKLKITAPPPFMDVTWNGIQYPNLKAACDAAGVLYGSVKHRVFERGMLPAEAIDYIRTHRRIKGIWTPERLEVLLREYPTKGSNIPELFEMGVTEKQITRYASKNKIKMDKETYIVHGTEYRTYREVADAYNINEGSIKYRVNECGMSVEEAVDFLVVSDVHRADLLWSEEDLAILREKYPKQGTDIPELLSKRASHCLVSKANALGLTAPHPSIVVRMDTNDVAKAARAYTSEDGVQYIFCRCGICGATLLMPRSTADTFRHGEACQTYECPDIVFLPNSMCGRNKNTLYGQFKPANQTSQTL